MVNKKILIIEDEIAISDFMSYSLSKEGYIVKCYDNGEEGIKALEDFKPNLIILDLMLPDINGFDICKKVTNTFNIPIIIITAKCDITDKILGMELGADDYITKPFDMREVIVRIKSIFRRIELTKETVENKSEDVITIQKYIHIYKDERKVLKNGEAVDLTPKEFDLILFLSENKGKVFSRAQLLDSVWGFEYIGDTRTVDIHVQRLRKKLDRTKNYSIIETVFGVGYKLNFS
ncbi:DNA-binding response OmpR family regulator [Clostridium tetanomorphum]|uniref:Stage 0 sporulation protein A homolog n=1 Tax=Clostridium tetanomorphum TaxID=1553 RepID=A0A923EC52_CLOTT|nr:response regulator transcription factor [Clostridium tetanomorphum]KAJ50606.1 signal transduction response regulator [Clostridium tetanomorphum DSM 665]MBC2399066.1 response regulator transcription factor [Clostridium tetanomorphum]MBP1862681.1 DNA-binding response OmpR family regulator [Clostridium tetanomorphum]NRS85479.1 DNA-binding response OmpR family regulator [Clostridium tetanomorphum]NRZ98593.1 DNA-binding response OmpR family regulator [Clostridium tetanomorphum]